MDVDLTVMGRVTLLATHARSNPRAQLTNCTPHMVLSVLLAPVTSGYAVSHELAMFPPVFVMSLVLAVTGCWMPSSW
jgi:hypothetical protein